MKQIQGYQREKAKRNEALSDENAILKKKKKNSNFLTQYKTGYKVEIWDCSFSSFCLNAKPLNREIIQYKKYMDNFAVVFRM